MPQTDPLDNLRVAAPCLASWAEMSGDARVRHCTLCSLNVYDFSEMTRAEVQALLARTEGRVCARLYRRSDGTVLTRDCPTGLRALRRRASRAATALITALLSFPSLAFAGVPWRKPRLKTDGGDVKLEVQRVVAQQAAAFTGIVLDEAGYKLPGVTISVRDESSKEVRTTITDANGAFSISSLNEGLYRVEVTVRGLKPATIEHLQLKTSIVTQAKVVLHLYRAMTMGVIVAQPMLISSDGNTTTVYSEVLRKLPF